MVADQRYLLANNHPSIIHTTIASRSGLLSGESEGKGPSTLDYLSAPSDWPPSLPTHLLTDVARDCRIVCMTRTSPKTPSYLLHYLALLMCSHHNPSAQVPNASTCPFVRTTILPPRCVAWCVE